MEDAVKTGTGDGNVAETPGSAGLQEAAWVAASQRGDTLAFNRLVLKWEGQVYNLALRMLQDADEAAEATQEIFLSAFKGIRRFRQEARFSTWLYRIAANQCTTRLRQRPPLPYLSLDDEETKASIGKHLIGRGSQETDLLMKENRQRVNQALSRLSPEQRLVVELKFYQDMTFEEMALVVQAPVSTVKTRLYTGLELLKSRLGRVQRTGRDGVGK